MLDQIVQTLAKVSRLYECDLTVMSLLDDIVRGGR